MSRRDSGTRSARSAPAAGTRRRRADESGRARRNRGRSSDRSETETAKSLLLLVFFENFEVNVNCIFSAAVYV